MCSLCPVYRICSLFFFSILQIFCPPTSRAESQFLPAEGDRHLCAQLLCLPALWLGRTVGTNNCYFCLQGFLLSYLLLGLYNYLMSPVPVRPSHCQLCLISILGNPCLHWTLAHSKFAVCKKWAFCSLCILSFCGSWCWMLDLCCCWVLWQGPCPHLALACDECIHALQHCFHCLFIGCHHHLEMSLMLILEEGKHHCGGLAFFLCCCQLLWCKGRILETRLFCGGLQILSVL